MRGLFCGVLVFFAFAGVASAGGPSMLVGAAEDIAKQPDPAFAKSEMDLAKLAGLDSIRVTQTWARGQRAPTANQRIALDNAVNAAQFAGIRVILSLFPFGSSVTPLTDQDRGDFAAFAVAVAKQYPLVHDFIIGNEPNLNRFWLPQFGPSGEDVAAPAYEQLLATTYDALKLVHPHSTIYGGALAPRGVDKPGTGRDTHSPTAFINDLGAVYRASGRALPIMDAFALHPYPESSATGPDFPHPNSTTIGLADYDKLVGLLGTAFDGTAQRGSTLPILYDEFGIETQIPPEKATLYTGTEPAATHPVDEATQARMYEQAMAMTFCQKNVLGLLLFHFQDESALAAWQSGVFYVDGKPKASLFPVRGAAYAVHRGVISTCADLQLTPKLTLVTTKPTVTGVRVTLKCSLDCSYVVTVDLGHPVTGTATGGVARTLVFRRKLAKGRHRVNGVATAALNAGPPGLAGATFRVS